MTSTADIPAQQNAEHPEHAEATDEVQSLEQSRAEWEAEYDRVLYFDPNEVVIDVNVRTENATTDADTVRDMRARGVEQAVRGYRADDGTVMITLGQRRVLNAREAGVQVPVWMQAPPSADERRAAIERIVSQVNENALRQGLTLGDEHKARGTPPAPLGDRQQQDVRRVDERTPQVAHELRAAAHGASGSAAVPRRAESHR